VPVSNDRFGMWRAMSLLARWQWILARSDLIRREIAPQSAAGKRLLDFFFHPVVRDAPPGECQTHRRTVVSGGGAHRKAVVISATRSSLL
jgi:hypothetical protein